MNVSGNNPQKILRVIFNLGFPVVANNLYHKEIAEDLTTHCEEDAILGILHLRKRLVDA